MEGQFHPAETLYEGPIPMSDTAPLLEAHYLAGNKALCGY